ncbi:MAG: bifunctional homocysteine S-methyltransferase/methylenetetrahydrofolate reductase [Gammaproteobacteria bacterium]|nr:bifunctional homocysteine S-methyltransferase/methylenetetrahydrofolate reductase [Gammaproteobacteria bacterium]MYC52998.1 bifunctional homocysteine S-methyltransferase/methylenetetrahydrofolate reductase [Gammaproteobacteria bacterium]
MSVTLRDLIADGRAHVVDGAMGTMLYGKGVFVNVCYDELNLSTPEIVREVHEEYVHAGAEILETNTFGANPVKLSGFGLEERTEAINRAGARLARDAAAGRATVVGAMGPLGIRIEPWGATAFEEAVAFFKRQARGLIDGGVDGFCLETFSDLGELEAAFRAVRSLADLPVLAQVTIGDNGATPGGTTMEAAGAAMAEWGVEVAGINCSVGPAIMLDAVERLAASSGLPASAQPNAGLPRVVENRQIYMASPEYMGQYARRLVAAGARFVGGCCGTTAAHVRRIRDHVASVQPVRVRAAARGGAAERTGRSAVPLADRSAWGRKLATGRFVTTVQIAAPRGWRMEEITRQARALATDGVDTVFVVGGTRGQAHMGALTTAMLLGDRAGIEPLVRYVCRDRDMHGMISDLLGASAAGIRNLQIVSGESTDLGPYADSTAISDIDSIGLVNVVHHLNRGLDAGGNDIGAPTELVAGVGLDQAAVDQDSELSRFAWKVDAGADFAVTRPLFDPGRLEDFMARADTDIPVIATLLPLSSLRNAEFMANEVPGVEVPEGIVQRMRAAERRSPAHARAEGLSIAREMFAGVRHLVRGVRVRLPDDDLSRAAQLLSRL